MKYFLDVAATEHMTQSAHRLGIAQPALSRQIARLEQELGTKLFLREGRGLHLTREGRLLKDRLTPVVGELENIKRNLAYCRDDARQEIRIHLGAASHIAADAIAGWMAENPNARVVLTQMGQGTDQDTDIIVDSLRPPSSAACRSFSERVMVAMSATTPTPNQSLSFAELSKSDFVSLSSQSGFSRFTHELCRSAGFEPRIVFESDNPSVVRKVIALGLGIGFWPEHSWGGTREGDVKLVPLDTEIRREVHLCLTGANDAPLVQEFYAYLSHYFALCFSSEPMKASMVNSGKHLSL